MRLESTDSSIAAATTTSTISTTITIALHVGQPGYATCIAVTLALVQDRTQLLLEEKGLEIIRNIKGPIVPVVVIGAQQDLRLCHPALYTS